jgi:pyruvate/2-oxoglutarate dehydrogenase complex dihydrolipoamide dehydrogenase (E3) component
MIATNALVLAKNGDRISSQISDAPELFAVGDWVGDEGMLLDAALASAESAAARIIAMAGVAKVA